MFFPRARVTPAAGRASDYLARLQQADKGGEKAAARHLQRGRLLVRDRVSRLLDPGTSLLELAPCAAHGVYGREEVPCAGLVTGLGVVNGVQVMVVANDPSVKAGAYFPLTTKKHVRATEIAMQNQLPCVYLVDSAGGFLPLQAEGFADRDHFGRIFFSQATMSAAGVPQVSVVLGSCTAGGAYIPAMSDETIMVQGQGTIFLGGPPLVKAALSEIVSSEDLGGADLHCRRSGVADHLAASEPDALQIARDIVEDLNYPAVDTQPPKAEQPPALLPSDAAGLSPVDACLGTVLDSQRRLSEFHELFGTELCTRFSRLGGWPVGVLASRGPLTEAAALKGAHFVQLCEQRGVPLLFVVDTSPLGEAAASSGEERRRALHVGQLMNAVSTASVPVVTLVVGRAVGWDAVAMGGRSLSPRFHFMWPDADVGMEGAPEAFAAADAEARLWTDGVVFPEETREVLKRAFAATRSRCRGREEGRAGMGVMRM